MARSSTAPHLTCRHGEGGAFVCMLPRTLYVRCVSVPIVPIKFEKQGLWFIKSYKSAYPDNHIPPHSGLTSPRHADSSHVPSLLIHQHFPLLASLLLPVIEPRTPIDPDPRFDAPPPLLQ
jgi:hypothetical protein